MARISERVKIDADLLEVTSAQTDQTVMLDYSGVTNGAFVVNIFSTAGLSSGVTVDLMASSAIDSAGSSVASLRVGPAASSAISASDGVRSVKLTMSSATTTGNSFRFGLGSNYRTFSYTTSTALLASNAWTTVVYYGSTVGSTVDTGLQLTADSLKAALQSTRNFGSVLNLTTDTTASLVAELRDNVPGGLSFGTTVSDVPACAVLRAVGIFDVDEADVDARYIGLRCSTASTVVKMSVVGLRDGSYLPFDQIAAVAS